MGKEDHVSLRRITDLPQRNCVGIHYLPKAAEGIKGSGKLPSVKSSIYATLTMLKKQKESRQQYMAAIDKDRANQLKQVQDLKDRLIKQINDLEKQSSEEIHCRHKNLTEKVKADIQSIDKTILKMEKSIEKLDQDHKNNEAQVFLDINQGKNHEAEGHTLLQHLSTLEEDTLLFVVKTDIEYFLHNLPSLGGFVDDIKVKKAKHQGDYQVKVSKDKSMCNIVGSCLLPDGTMVLTDWNNNRLKHLDTSYRVTDHIVVPSEPWGVTCTDNNQVAITLTNLMKVQFVTLGDKMSMTRTFSTGDHCRGICCSNGELFVSCRGMRAMSCEEGPGHVKVYNLAGILQHTIQTGPAGQQIFSIPYHITVSTGGTKIHVADRYNGVITMDRRGTILSSSTDQVLVHTCSVCALDNNHILVCGLNSNNVFIFSSNGKKLTELLGDTDSIEEPKSLCYDSVNSRLIVTQGDSDCIKVYDLI